jgi:hypothetical protein
MELRARRGNARDLAVTMMAAEIYSDRQENEQRTEEKR